MGMGWRPPLHSRGDSPECRLWPPAQNQESTFEDLWLEAAGELTNPPRLFQPANLGGHPGRVFSTAASDRLPPGTALQSRAVLFFCASAPEFCSRKKPLGSSQAQTYA